MNKRLGTYLGNNMWNGLMADALSDYFSKHEKEWKDKWVEIWVNSSIYMDAPLGHLNHEVRKIVGQFKEFNIRDYVHKTEDDEFESIIDRNIVVKHYNYVKKEFGRVEGESLYYIGLNNICSIRLTSEQEPVGLVENIDKMSSKVSYKPLEEAKNWGEAWLKKEIESLKLTLEIKEKSLKKITKGSD